MEPIHFYNRELETLDRERLAELQDEKLRGVLKELSANEFYAEKFCATGLHRLAVRRYEELRALPFTTKSELADEQEARPPFGRLLSYPLSRYRYFHQTSGTSGRPLRWLDTEEDWETWIRCWGYVYRGAGVTQNDIVFCAFSFGPYVSHWTALAGARRIGAMGIAGGGMNSEQRLKAILDNRCSVLVCTPTYALHLAEVARQRGLDLRSSPVRVSIHAGEPGASLPNVKRAIEEGWGVTCFDHAGATEVGAWAFDCQAQSGAIHLNENEFVFEVIDPETCEPASEGVRGELVVTTLGRAGMPVLRYRTGDLVEMTTSPCSCGRTLARIRGGVLGRADEMLIVRGVNLYPSAIDNLLRGLPGILEYEVEIRRVTGLDDLLVKIETADGRPMDYQRAVTEAFRTELNIGVSVETVARGSLPRYELKAQRFKCIPQEN